MLTLGEFNLTEKIYESEKTLVFRGHRLGETQSIVAKLLRSEFASKRDVAAFKREYRVNSKLPENVSCNPIAFVNDGSKVGIVVQDNQGHSLDRLEVGAALSVSTIGSIGTRVVELLKATHDARIIHKDINPSNITWNAENGEARLIDFGISSVLGREEASPAAPGFIEGTLAFTAPEQTGRMNRSVDYRSDYYSFGATLYYLTTGVLPFELDDPVAMVHAQMALAPPDPRTVRPDVPAVLSGVILKLLEKNPEDRYQSAHGLAADLALLAESLNGTTPEIEFLAGEKDRSVILQIPEKLYGRESHIEKILEGFAELGHGGQKMVVVTGEAGVGKTSLVNEIHKPVTETRGTFLRGKFDQFRRNVPYSALIQAFRDLARQILAEPEGVVDTWRQNISQALGGQGQLITDVISEMELILGPQAAVSPLPPAEAKRRFSVVLRSFVQCFSSKQHPLVLFLDDLQWADLASLSLLKELVLDSESCHLLVVGAYRDHEVSSDHPLAEFVRTLTNHSALTKIVLENLQHDAVQELLVDTLSLPPADCETLVGLCQDKTGGNPFFLVRFLASIFHEGMLRFVAAPDRWVWDEEQIANTATSENVVDLLLEELAALPPSTQTLLRQASCIGAVFDLHTLGVTAELSAVQLMDALWPALEKGYVVPVGGDYKYLDVEDLPAVDEPEVREGALGLSQVRYRFLHDRVQQAAYPRRDPAVRAQVHIRIGRLLKSQVSTGSADLYLFDIVRHMAIGEDLIDSVDEKFEVARLNLRSAGRARASSAFSHSRDMLRRAVRLLPADGWSEHYDLLFQVHTERADAEFLCGDIAAAESLYVDCLAQARSTADKANIYERRIHFYAGAGDFRKAYDTGREALLLYGVKLPASFVPPLFIKDLVATKLKLRRTPVQSIVDLPTIEDPSQETSMRLWAALLKSAYQIKPELCVAVATRMVRASLDVGNMRDTALAYFVFGGIFHGGVLGQHNTGYEFGRLALALNEKYDHSAQEPEVRFIYAYFCHSWKNHARTTEEYYRRAFETGQQCGDYFHASCAASAICQSKLMRGASLSILREEIGHYLTFTKRVENFDATQSLLGMDRAAMALMGDTSSLICLNDSDSDFDEDKFVAGLEEFGSKHFAHFYFVNKMQALYLAGAYEQALDMAKQSEAYLTHSVGMLHAAEHHFCHALILLAICRKTHKRGRLLRTARGIGRKLKLWAVDAPENFEHKSLLLDAQFAALEGKPWKASSLFERAIESSLEAHFQQYAALGSELAGEFHLEHDRLNEGLYHLRRSALLYDRWGASEKVRLLTLKIKDLAQGTVATLEGLRGATLASQNTTTTTQSHSAASLDLWSVLKASRAISAERDVDCLVRRVLELLIENTGATHGALVVQEETQNIVYEHSNTAILPLSEYQGLAKSMVRFVVRTKESLLVGKVREDERFSEDPHVQTSACLSVLCAPILSRGELLGLVYLESDLAEAFTHERLETVQLLASQAAVSLEAARVHRTLEDRVERQTQELRGQADELRKMNEYITHDVLKRYLPPDIVDHMVEHEIDLNQEPIAAEVTLLFCDLVGSTPLALELGAKKMAAVINSFLSAMADVIFTYRGTIDKFTGDGLMAIFGAPTPVPPNEQAAAAVACGLKMQRRMHALNQEWAKLGVPFVQMRIGIDFGAAIVGIFGSKSRSEYTAIGPAPNSASRIEGQCKPGDVYVSAAVFEFLTPAEADYVGPFTLKGIGDTTLYRIRREDEGKAATENEVGDLESVSKLQPAE